MEKTAKLILNSYNEEKIRSALLNIRKSTEKLKLTLESDDTAKIPVRRIWGCQTHNLKQQVMSIHGSTDDFRKLLSDLKLTEGVYIQLLPSE